jgi:hypothetical protein
MEPSTDEMNEIAQLAKTFSVACKEAVEEGKVTTRTVPVIAAALVLLTAGAAVDPHW